MRVSSSTTSRCGASSSGAGRIGIGPSHCVSMASPWHVRRADCRSAPCSSGLTIAFRNRSIACALGRLDASNAARMRRDCGRASASASARPFGGRVELALPAVARALHLDDVAGVDQLLQHARQALLGDLQHVEQFGHGQARHAVDEMQHAVMRAAEAVVGQDLVGIGGEVAIGEEEQLDDARSRCRPRRSARFVIGLAAACCVLPSCLLRSVEIYVSIVDIILRAMVIFAKLFGRLRTKRQGRRGFSGTSLNLPSHAHRAYACRSSAIMRRRRERNDNDMRAAARGRYIMASVPFDQLDGLIWMNGEFVKWADAKIHVLTHGLHYASAVFEGERAYGGEIFKLTEHTERLHESARAPRLQDSLFASPRSTMPAASC